MSLVTLQQVRDYLGEAPVDRLPWIEQQIEAVSAVIAGADYCAQPIEYDATYAYEFRPPQPLCGIALPFRPVHEATRLRYTLINVPGAEWVEIESGQYEVRKDGPYVLCCGFSFWPDRQYEATLRLGYWPADSLADPPAGVARVPVEVQDVALEMIAYRYDQRYDTPRRRGLKSDRDVTPEGQATRSFFTPEELRREWRQRLAGYSVRGGLW